MLLVFVCGVLFLTPGSLISQNKEVLVFHKTADYYHVSIPAGIRVLDQLGEEHGFNVTATRNAAMLEEDELEHFDLVVFFNTTGDILNKKQKEDFERFIEQGGSFFGIHSAADTEYKWEWYGALVGAYFLDHPKVQKANIIVEAPEHPTVAHLPEVWTRTDEWYNYKEINPNIKILLRLDDKSYKGGKGKNLPIAWYQELAGGGVSIYTGGGHTPQSYEEPEFVEHLLRCILFALENRGTGD